MQINWISGQCGSRLRLFILTEDSNNKHCENTKYVVREMWRTFFCLIYAGKHIVKYTQV